MDIVLTGSIAFDYLMFFPGRFKDHILADRLERLSLSFLVESLVRRPGGIAANIAYTMALLGERPTVMATVGKDFEEYRGELDAKGVDTSGIVTVPELFTASFFVNTDTTNAQIASFYSGAMERASELRFADLPSRPTLAVISANDPTAMENYIDECRQLDIAYVYDPSQQTVRLDGDGLRKGIASCLALFVNDYEFGLIEEKTELTINDILRNSQFVVITKGGQGAEIHTGDGLIEIPAIEPKEMVDPTGVGDAFRAGFLTGYLHRFGFERCGQMGSVAAAYCLESEGPQGHDFDLPDFLARFRHHFSDEGELEQLR
ncbi:MAG: carbohydrate kinase family protein [Anaerolineales bacterium]